MACGKPSIYSRGGGPSELMHQIQRDFLGMPRPAPGMPEVGRPLRPSLEVEIAGTARLFFRGLWLKGARDTGRKRGRYGNRAVLGIYERDIDKRRNSPKMCHCTSRNVRKCT